MTGAHIEVDGGETVLVLGVADDGRLHQVGLGGPEHLGASLAFPIGLYPLAYPTFGEEVLREPALRATHADGATSTRLVVHDIDGTRVVLRDRVAPLTVELCWRARPEHGLVEQWVEVVNDGPAPCTLHQAASAALALANADDAWFTHWGGGWAHEWTETTERLAKGVKTVASAGGVRTSLHLPPVVLWAPSGRATETAGDVLAATLVWGGDARFDAEVAMHRHARLIAGVQHRGAERTLAPGERHVAPPVLVAWSSAGIGPTSRRFHRFVHDEVVRDGAGTRAIVFNNWEAQGMALDDERVGAVVDGAAALGAELFLLDDGWFGRTYPRDEDDQGLGDWMVDARKFPEGLRPTIERTLAAGMRFGLWVEPEMVNPRSELAEAHPDWAIGEPGREAREERQQLVLDLCRPEVAAFVVETIDHVLTEHPGISYLKWDANRNITEPGSLALDADAQARHPMDRVRATMEVMAEVARRHPEVELMACASGGGRSDLATLRSFHELWTSDNTDPEDRVRIQWGASHLLPAGVLGAHVTRWGQKPVAFGCAVALSARFGFDIDPAGLDGAERAAAAQAVEACKRTREVVQHGDLHRLASPVQGDRASLAYVLGDRAVVFAFRLAGDLEPPAGELVDVPLTVGEATVLTPGAADHGTTVGALHWPTGPGPVAAVWDVRRAT